MKWSLSGSKTFRRCQRQWFYKNCVANGVTKDPVRRNIYLLGKLQTIAGWRGSIVDHAIETGVVPALQSGRLPDCDTLIARARRLYDLQLATALEHPPQPPGSRVTGFQLLREKLMATAPRPDSKIREAPGIFIVKDDCPNTARTLPTLPRNPKNLDDINPDSELHIYDAIRYALQADRSPRISTHRRYYA